MKDLFDAKVIFVTTIEDVVQFKQWLGQRRDFLALDTETSGLNKGKDFIRLIQFADHDTAWAFPYEDWRGVAKEVLEKYNQPIVCHNLLFDSGMLKKDGLVIPQRFAHDTLIMSFLKDPSARFDLKGSATRWVDKRAAVGRGILEQAMAAAHWTWETVPVDFPLYWSYGGMDTLLTSRLASKLYPEIQMKFKEAYDLELGAIHCLREAELAGLLTDPDYIERAASKLTQEISGLRPQIPCDPDSDKQVIGFLQSIGVPLFMLTEKGNLSCDKEVLHYFQKEYPVCGLISEYRSKARMLGNYICKFSALAVDDILRASTRPVGARTGRQSVTDPPLQTLPRGRLVRDAIVARPGHRFCMADFSGMEMRILASEAKEENMLAAYGRGEDLHNFVAKSLYGEHFTKQQRTVCKNAGFSKIFGAGPEKFATTAQISPQSAREFLEKYNEMFPRVDQYMDTIVQKVMERSGGRQGTGWVKLIDGTILPIPGDKAYIATNYRIQGSASKVMKRKVVELNHAGLGDCFRLAVHDELLFEVPEADAPEARHLIETIMPEKHAFPNVTLEIDYDEVNRWGQHYRKDGYPKYIETEDPEWLT